VKSFRTRLILSNTIVIALMSVLVGGALAWLNLSRLDMAIDRELTERARNATRFRGPGSNGGPFGGGPEGGGPRGGPGFGAGQGQGQGQGFGQGQGPGPRNPFNDPIGQIRRPRILMPDGRAAGPNQEVAFDRDAISRAKVQPVFSEVKYQGEQVRVYTQFFEGPDGEERVVQTARELRDYEELKRIQGVALLILIPAALLAAIGAGVLLSRSALGPIAALKEAISRFTEGDRSGRIIVQGNDEFADLTHQYNQMADRVDQAFAAQDQAYAALTHSYEQQRRFVADASHELRTPLTRIQLIAANAADDDDEGKRQALQAIQDSTAGLAKLIRQLLDLARVDAGETQLKLEEVDLRAWMADLIASDSGEPKVELDLADAPVIASIDRSMMERVMINLIDNARRHTPASGSIRVSVLAGAVISVSDTGSGIPERDLPRVFDRFYRADSSRTETTGGTGLGLAIVKEIVKLHGGEVSIESQLGEGTQVKITLQSAQNTEPS